jgi:hypothetical protein
MQDPLESKVSYTLPRFNGLEYTFLFQKRGIREEQSIIESKQDLTPAGKKANPCLATRACDGMI